MLSWNCGCSLTPHHEDIEIISLHMPNDLTSKYIKQNLWELQRETDSSRIIAGVPNTFLPETGRLSRQKKISYSVEDLYNIT